MPSPLLSTARANALRRALLFAWDVHASAPCGSRKVNRAPPRQPYAAAFSALGGDFRGASKNAETAVEPGDERALTQDLILKVLSTRPTQRQARHFIKRYVDHPTPAHTNKALHQHLALIKVPANLNSDALSSFAATLVQLQKLNLQPIVILDSSRHVKQWAPPSMRDLRTLDSVDQARATKEWREKMLAAAFRVADIVDRSGGRGMPVYNGVFNAYDDEQRSPDASGPSLANLPPPITIGLQAIHVCLELAQIPILVPVACSHRYFPLPPALALLSLSRALVNDKLSGQPMKIIMVNHQGGVQINGRPVGFINLEDEYDEIVAALRHSISHVSKQHIEDDPQLADRVSAVKQRLKDLAVVKLVMSALPASSSAMLTSVASSASLISNLITDKPISSSDGAEMRPTGRMHFNGRPDCVALADGRPPVATTPLPPVRSLAPDDTPTVIRRGLNVQHHSTLASVDLASLHKLLDLSFGKPLDAQAYFRRLGTVLNTMIVAGDYHGAAIVTNEPFGDPGDEKLPYLCKFAVAPNSQGMGVADILWKHLRQRYPDLAWRSRSDNGVNKWYFERSEGNIRLKGEEWVVFWYGPRGMKRMEAYKRMGSSVPPSFLKNHGRS